MSLSKAFTMESDDDLGLTSSIISSSARSCVLKVDNNTVIKRYFKKALRRDAIKKSQKSDNTVLPIDIISNEIDNLRRLNCSGVIKLLSVEETPTSIILALEYGGVTLSKDGITTYRRFTSEELKNLLRQLLDITIHIHSQDIIHCDIKPSNILIDPSSKIVKLCDFGSSIYWNHSISLEKPPRTTPSFTSPEQLSFYQTSSSPTNSGFLGKPLDVWALGVTFYCLIYQKHPFNVDGSIFELNESINSAAITFDNNSIFASEFLQRMLERDPLKRIQIHTISI